MQEVDYYEPQAAPQQAPANLWQTEDMVKFVKELHNDERLNKALDEPIIKSDESDDKIGNKFFGHTNKHLMLGFTPEKMRKYYYAKFNSGKCNFLMTIPSYKKNMRTRQITNNIETSFMSILGRSIGTTSHITNERILVAQNVQQNISSSTNDNVKSGVLGKMKGLFGFGKNQNQ